MSGITNKQGFKNLFGGNWHVMWRPLSLIMQF